MGCQIIPESTGDRFAVFSSNTDSFVLRDMTREEVFQLFVEEARLRAFASVQAILDKIAKGEKPYHQFTLTLEEAIRMHLEHDGDASLVTAAERESVRVTP